MPKLTKLCLGTALALGLAVPVMAQTATKPAADTATAAKPAPTADTVVATVNGTKITLGNVIALRDQLPPQYRQLPDPVLFKGIVDQLIQQSLLEQSMQGKMTKQDKLALENSQRAFVAGVALSEITKSAVTDAALNAAYKKQYADVKPGTEYHAAHILVSTKQEAEKIKAQLDKGASFAKLAKQDSKDGSAANGGDLGWFGKGMMVKPFEDAVMKLKPGQVSDPVQTQFGWHIIKLEGTRPGKVPTLDQVRGKLAKEIEQKAVTAKIDALTKNAKITRDTSGIDPKVMRDQKLLQN